MGLLPGITPSELSDDSPGPRIPDFDQTILARSSDMKPIWAPSTRKAIVLMSLEYPLRLASLSVHSMHISCVSDDNSQLSTSHPDTQQYS